MIGVENCSEMFPTAFEKAIYEQYYIKHKTYFTPKSINLIITFKLFLIYR